MFKRETGESAFRALSSLLPSVWTSEPPSAVPTAKRNAQWVGTSQDLGRDCKEPPKERVFPGVSNFTLIAEGEVSIPWRGDRRKDWL